MFNRSKTTIILGILAFFITVEASLQAAPQRGRREYRTSSRRSNSRSIFNILLRDKDVQKDLGISEDQKTKLLELSGQASLSYDDAFREQLKAATSEEKKKLFADREVKRAALVKEKEAEARNLLSQKQRDGLDKIFVERNGLSALQQISIQTKMKLSEDQISSLEKLRKDREDASKTMTRRTPKEEREKFTQEWDAKTYQVFNSDQKKTWVSLGGKLAESSSSTPVVKTETEPAKVENGSEDAKEETTSNTETVKIAPKVVGDGSVKADFSPFEEKMKDTPFGKQATRKSSPQRNRRQRDAFSSFDAPKISFNFANAPWDTVLEIFAKKTDLTLVIPEVPTDKFNYRDSHEYTPTEALDILNGYLIQKGFTLIRQGRFLYLHNLENELPANMIPDVTVEGLYFRASNEIVRVTFRLQKGVDVEKLAQQIEDQQSGNFTAISMKASNAIIMIDTVKTILRIKDLIPVDELGPNELVFKYFKLQHISVDIAEELVGSQLGLTNGVRNVSDSGSNNSRTSNSRSSRRSSNDRSQQIRDWMSRMRDRGRDRGRSSRGGDSSRTSFQIATPSSTNSRGRTTSTNSSTQNTNAGKEKVTADRRNNALLVTCTSSTMKRIESIIEQIDISDPQGIKGDSGAPYLHVYPVTRSNIMETTKTINAIMPGIVVNEDGNFKMLSIFATAEQHRKVKELIDRLEGNGPGGVQIALISVGRMDPVAVANTLKRIFEGEGDTAPSIEADARGRRIIVRGTENHNTQIKKLVDEMLQNQRQGGLNGSLMWDASARGPEFLKMLNDVWNLQNPGQPMQFKFAPSQGPIRNRSVPSTEQLAPGLRIPGYDTPTQRPLERTSNPSRTPAKPENKPKRIEKDTATIDENLIVKTSYLDDEKKVLKDDKQSPKKPTPVQPEAAKPASENSAVAPQLKTTKKTPVTITMVNGQLLIRHPDPEVLNRVESMLEQLEDMMPVNHGWTVFYLRSADATTTAELLGKIFSEADVKESSAASSGSIFGNFFNRLGDSVADATGLQDANNLVILTDVRTNSLLVKGPPSKVSEVRQTLNVLDVSEVPASLKDRFPRSIPVKYADVNQIADNLKDLYKEELQPEGSNGGGQNAMLQMMMGGSRNRRGSGSNGNKQAGKIRLAISVDTRMGDLLVSANDSLFNQIETWVKNRDEAAKVGKYQSQVIQPLYTDPEKIQESLSQLSSKIQTSMVSGSTRNGSNSRNGSSNSSSQDARRRMFEQMMRGGSRGGSSRGGSTNRSNGRSSFSFGNGGRTRTFSIDRSSRGSSRGGFSRGGSSRSGRRGR